jgi:hypothetical protein
MATLVEIESEGRLDRRTFHFSPKSKYEIFKPLFDEVLERVATAKDRDDLVEAFLRQLNETYSLDEIEHLEPEVVRFMEEEGFERCDSSNGGELPLV